MRVGMVVRNEAEIVLENAPADNVFLSAPALGSNFELPAEDDRVSG
jgi:hypothetical protein